MALHAAPTPIARPRAVHGSRGVPTRVVLDVTDALAPCIEGVALTQEVLAGVNRILLAATSGSRMAVVNEANRLGYRALRGREEFRRMAEFIEGPDAA